MREMTMIDIIKFKSLKIASGNINDIFSLTEIITDKIINEIEVAKTIFNILIFIFRAKGMRDTKSNLS